MVIWGIVILVLLALTMLLAVCSAFVPSKEMGNRLSETAFAIGGFMVVLAIPFGITHWALAVNQPETEEQKRITSERIMQCEKEDKIWYDNYCFTTDGYREKTN